MLRASIFQKNILSKSDKSDFAESLQNCIVEIDEENITIYRDEIIILESQLSKFEDEFHTTSYKGKFSDNEQFRIIRPKEIGLANVKLQHNCISAFSIGSLNPDGYAIHFILTEKNDIRSTNTAERGTEEQIQRLIDGSVLALQNELFENFVDYSKRLLKLVESGYELKKYQHGDEILKVMRNNSELYTFGEKAIIYN